MKCKVINSSKTVLENDVNEWLESGNYEIFKVLQTEYSNGYITLTIFYYTKNEARAKKLLKIEKSAK